MSIWKEAIEGVHPLLEKFLAKGLQWPVFYIGAILLVNYLDEKATRQYLIIGLFIAFILSCFLQLFYEAVQAKRNKKIREEASNYKNGLRDEWDSFQKKVQKEASEIVYKITYFYPKHRTEEPEKWDELNKMASEHEAAIRNFYV